MANVKLNIQLTMTAADMKYFAETALFYDEDFGVTIFKRAGLKKKEMIAELAADPKFHKGLEKLLTQRYDMDYDWMHDSIAYDLPEGLIQKTSAGKKIDLLTDAVVEIELEEDAKEKAQAIINDARAESVQLKNAINFLRENGYQVTK